jgi:hypothetical protein
MAILVVVSGALALLLIGCFIGMLIMAMCSVAHNADEQSDAYLDNYVTPLYMRKDVGCGSKQ